MENLQRSMDLAATFILETWVDVVNGSSYEAGAPKVKFDNERDRGLYADSIVMGEKVDIPSIGMFSRTILATDPIAEQIEMGKPPWDMKPMLLGGSKARMSKAGNLYNIIPFRHGTTSSGGEIFKPMPSGVHDAAKLMDATIARGKKILKYGGKLTGTEGSHPAQKSMFIKPSGKVGRYQHKSGKYEGMLKIQSGGQNRYMTFRVVSELSDPSSWWHKGNPPQSVARWVEAHVRERIEKMLVTAAMNDMMDDTTVGMSVIAERGL